MEKPVQVQGRPTPERAPPPKSYLVVDSFVRIGARALSNTMHSTTADAVESLPPNLGDEFRVKYAIVDSLRRFSLGAEDIGVSSSEIGWPEAYLQSLEGDSGREEVILWYSMFDRTFASLVLIAGATDSDLQVSEWRKANEAIDRALFGLRIRAMSLSKGEAFTEPPESESAH